MKAEPTLVKEKTAKFLEDKGIDYTYDPNFSLDNIDIDNKVLAHIRLKEGINKQYVDRYRKVIQKCREDGEPLPFPPTVVYQIKNSNKVTLVNGHHRYEAYAAEDVTHIPVYVIPYDPDIDVIDLGKLATGLNARVDTSILANDYTNEQKVVLGIELIEAGVPRYEAAQIVDLAPNTLTWHHEAKQLQEHCYNLELPPSVVNSVQTGIWNAIAPFSHMKWFKDIVEICARDSVTVADAKQFADGFKVLPDDEARKKAIERFSKEFPDTTTRKQGAVARKSSPASPTIRVQSYLTRTINKLESFSNGQVVVKQLKKAPPAEQRRVIKQISALRNAISKFEAIYND